MGASETERGTDESNEGGGMTQDQIIQMLRKVIAENQNYTTWTVSTPHLVALVNHAINEEREACAALCFQMWNKWLNSEDKSEFTRPDAEDCAAQIRARRQA